MSDLAASLAERVVEVAVVNPGDKLIVKVPNGMPLDPYSEEPAESQLQGFARRLNESLGDEVSVVVIAGGFELTVIRARGAVDSRAVR